MQGKIVVFLQVGAKFLAHSAQVDRIPAGHDLHRTAVPACQIDQRQPAGIFGPAVVGFERSKQDANHGSNTNRGEERPGKYSYPWNS